jgi:hypothetical protein
MLTRQAVTSALACALVATGACSAYAADDPDISKGDCDMMSFCVGVSAPGGKATSGQHRGTRSRGFGGASTSKPPCTVIRADPQPPPGSMFYQGKGKIVYERRCTDGNGLDNVSYVGAAPGAGVPALDPAALAQRAVDKMTLLGPDIANPRTARTYTVGVPMWMWVNQSATTYGPNTASATAGGVTVTATAKVSKIVWTMGDGASVTCHGPGTPYSSSEGMAQSPTCGHLYAKSSGSAPSGKFPVTATSIWTIDWQGGGQAGQLTEVRQTHVQVAVGEVQVVR